MSLDLLFTTLPPFETARLHLRALTEADLDALYALYRQPEVAEYSDADPLTSMEEAEELLAYFQEAYAERAQARWGIVLKQTSALIGACAIFGFDMQHRRAEIGYELSSAYWGQGIMAEALRPMLAYSFTALDLHRIEAIVTPENTRSARLLEKLGFRHEGTLRQRFFFHDRFWDDAFYGVLKGEFLGKS